MTYDLPHVGFGDPDNMTTFARFHVEKTDEGEYPDWQSEILSDTRQFAGSSSFETQIGGFGPSTITLSLWFDTRDDYRAFRSRYASVATLSLLAHFTSQEGIVRHRSGRDYEEFTDTLLLNVTNVRHQAGGEVACDATFQRAYDPRVAL